MNSGAKSLHIGLTSMGSQITIISIFIGLRDYNVAKQLPSILQPMTCSKAKEENDLLVKNDDWIYHQTVVFWDITLRILYNHLVSYICFKLSKQISRKILGRIFGVQDDNLCKLILADAQCDFLGGTWTTVNSGTGKASRAFSSHYQII